MLAHLLTRNVKKLMLTDARPIYPLEKRMVSYRRLFTIAEPSARIWIQQSLNKIFTLNWNLVLLCPNLRPFDLPPQNIVKYGLLGKISKRSHPNHNFISNNTQRKPIYGTSRLLSIDHLRSNVVRSPKKRIRLLLLIFFDQLRKVKISKDKLSILCNDYVILYGKISTGLRSRWIIPKEWIDSIASTRLARYTLAYCSSKYTYFSRSVLKFPP